MTNSEIIDLYYADNEPLRALLVHHSEQVRDHALRIADQHPELSLDRQLLADGAMLHDIGIVLCNAPGIHCHGRHHYIAHGRVGGHLLRRLASQGLQNATALARICERHTGTGLPGYEPETIEEQIICYADKFYSKSHPERVSTPEQAAASLSRFGRHCADKFWEWHERFNVLPQ